MRILSLQGGGCLGKGQAVALSIIEGRLGGSISSGFDLIAGTSVGSINGGCLALGKSASVINGFFDEDAPKIFSHNLLNDVGEVEEAKYSPQILYKQLQSVTGTATLADCKTKFMATSFDCVSGKVVHFVSWGSLEETPYKITIGPESGIFMWQVMAASSAAQLYFPAYDWTDKKGRKFRFRDGGNSGVNAPDFLAFVKALGMASTADIKMLSLGAGRPAWSFGFSDNPGVIEVIKETVEIVFPAAENQSVAAAAEALGANHLRLDALLPKNFAIDDATPETFTQETIAWQKAVLDKSEALNAFLGVGK